MPSGVTVSSVKGVAEEPLRKPAGVPLADDRAINLVPAGRRRPIYRAACKILKTADAVRGRRLGARGGTEQPVGSSEVRVDLRHGITTGGCGSVLWPVYDQLVCEGRAEHLAAP